MAGVLILVRGPISSKVTVREPKAADVVYVQEGEHWKMYPANAPTIKKTITLTDATGEYEGLSVAVEPVVGSLRRSHGIRCATSLSVNL
jgi:hypothetical protein